MVNDEDLSDQAIFDRLTNDVKFRSLATQLLQRYGYFKPQFNPLSDEAKEQDLVLKERARKLVEIEAQQDALALDEQKEARKAEREAAEKRINCRPGSLLESQDENYNQLIDCRDLEMMQRQQNPLQPGTNQMINPTENLPLPSIPDLGVPATSGSSIMRAQANPMDQLGGTDNMGGAAGGGSSTDSSSLMNMSMRNSGMGLSGGGLQMPGSEVGSLEALQGGALQGGLGGNPAAGNYSMAGALPETMQPGPRGTSCHVTPRSAMSLLTPSCTGPARTPMCLPCMTFTYRLPRGPASQNASEGKCSGTVYEILEPSLWMCPWGQITWWDRGIRFRSTYGEV